MNQRDSFKRHNQPLVVIQPVIADDLQQLSTLLSKDATAQNADENADDIIKLGVLYERLAGTLFELALAEDLNRGDIEVIVRNMLYSFEKVTWSYDTQTVKSNILERYDWLIHEKAKGKKDIKSRPFFDDEPAYAFNSDKVLDMRNYISSRLKELTEEE